MISLLGIAGWFVVGVIIGCALTLVLVAYWDRKVDLRLMEPLAELPVCEHGQSAPHVVIHSDGVRTDVYDGRCPGPITAERVSA